MLRSLRQSFLGSIYDTLTHIGEIYLFPILILGMRVQMAQVFFYSGLAKIQNWQGTLYLFQYEYAVPHIPAHIAAPLATAAELICPILILSGFSARFGALALLIMTAVIELTYQHSLEHYYWGFLLGTIMLYGPGFLSLDHFITKLLTRNVIVGNVASVASTQAPAAQEIVEENQDRGEGCLRE